MPERRRQPRAILNDRPEATDAESGEPIGQVLNINSEGLMLLRPEPLSPRRILQLRIPIQHEDGSAELQIGVDVLWCEPASVPGQHWVGCSIIDISPDDAERLQQLTDAGDLSA